MGLLALLGGCGLGKVGAARPIEGVDSQMYSVDLDSGRFEIAYAATGTPRAQRVIFVHGTPGSMSAWTRYLQNPIDGAESVAIDRPGFGSTIPSKAVCSFADQAQAIEPLLVQREGKWPILVGHSLGGPIVARVAADYPDRIDSIVILAGSLSHKLEHPKWFNYAGAFPLVRLFLSPSLNHSNKEILAAPKQTRELDRVLDTVTCPVVIVHGKKDHLVPFANVKYMKSAFSNAQKVTVVDLEHEDHFIPWTQEELVRRIIERLLAEDDNGQHADDKAAQPLSSDGNTAH